MELHVSLVEPGNVVGEIYRQIRAAILDGRLCSGDRLPPTRELAHRLSVSRTTVVVAYDRLAGEGYLTSRIGAGTFVAVDVTPPAAATRGGEVALRARPFWSSVRLPPDLSTPARFDFRPGVPDVAMFPFPLWRSLMAGELRPEATGTGAYAEPAGDAGLRTAIARHVGVARRVHAAPDDVVVTNGTQQAVDLVGRVLLAAGDIVAVEDPGYPPPRILLESLGMRVVGVPVDAEGMVVDAIPAGARLVVVSPSHQFPLGMAMSLRRRMAVLDWARNHGAAVLEDDYDSEFRYGGRPIEPLQSLDAAQRVIYVGSFSKTTMPSLRLGFVIAPAPLSAALAKAKYLSDWHSSLPGQRVLARFIEEGHYARHLRRMRTVYQARHERIVSVLTRDFADHLEVVPSAAGLHISAVTRDRSAEEVKSVVRRAADDGVRVVALAVYAAGPPTHIGIVLGYGSIGVDRIDEGLRRLKGHFSGHR